MMDHIDERNVMIYEADVMEGVTEKVVVLGDYEKLKEERNLLEQESIGLRKANADMLEANSKLVKEKEALKLELIATENKSKQWEEINKINQKLLELEKQLQK